MDRDGFIHRSWMKNQGIPDHEFDGRPIIGICNTWSELTPCNAHFRDLAGGQSPDTPSHFGLVAASAPDATNSWTLASVKVTNAPCPPELSGGTFVAADGSQTPGAAGVAGSLSPRSCDISGQGLPGVSKWALSYGAEIGRAHV
mgnify:CR=1 FL=1